MEYLPHAYQRVWAEFSNDHDLQQFHALSLHMRHPTAAPRDAPRQKKICVSVCVTGIQNRHRATRLGDVVYDA